MNVDAGLVLGSVATLMIIMLVGAAARIFGVIDRESTKKLSVLLVTVIQPFMIVDSMQIEYTPELLKTGGGILLGSLVVHAVVAVIAFFAFRSYPDAEKKIYSVATIFGNCGFLGFPVLKVVFGDVGLFYGAFYTFMFNVLMFSYGVFLYTRGSSSGISLKKVFINSGTIASFIGFMLFVLNIRLPSVVGNTVSMVGDLTFPVSMILIGSLACEKGYKKLFSGVRVYSYAIIKLLLLPVLTLLVCLIAGVQKEMTYLYVTMTAVPGATAAATFADMYGCDSKLAAKIVGFSTLLSTFTIPLILLLTGLAYGIAGR